MRIFAGVLALCALGGCAAVPMAGPQITSEALEDVSADTAFANLSARYLDALAELNPVEATRLGNHAYDGNLPEISASARAVQRRTNQGFLAALKTIDTAQLTSDNQVDYALLKNALEYSLWQDETEQQWAWNPQYYNDIVSNSLYSLVARDFAPWPQRFAHIVERMEKLPAFLAESRAQIDIARVPKIHAETVAKQNAGIMEIVDAALLPEVEQSGVPRTRFDAALANLKAAVAEHQTWLDTVLVPGAQGDFRLGTQKYAAKMKFALLSDMTQSDLKAAALKAKQDVRSEMYGMSRAILAEKLGAKAPAMPEVPDGATQQRIIEQGLAYSYANRAPRDQLEQRARETLAQATDFVRERDFVRMPKGAVQIITMPKFWQGNAVAYDDAPGPLERDLPNYYAVSPVPADWTSQQADSFLSEYNMYMLHDLSIHEAMPGHYLQLDHANENPSLLRAVLGSGPFVEGWAVYGEGLMSDEGYLGGMATTDGKLFRLTMLKMRLRSITNTLLDIGIHTEGMTRDDAMRLMMDGAFQQEREAAGKWIRANLTSVQLLSYFSGYEEHTALRAEAQQRWGADFTLRRYHDAVLSHGSPPVKYARALIFELPVE